jgi:hypothetical protein
MKPDWLHVFPDTNFFFECRDAFDREFIRPTKGKSLCRSTGNGGKAIAIIPT